MITIILNDIQKRTKWIKKPGIECLFRENKTMGFRVSQVAENNGIDLAEHTEVGYDPEPGLLLLVQRGPPDAARRALGAAGDTGAQLVAGPHVVDLRPGDALRVELDGYLALLAGDVGAVQLDELAGDVGDSVGRCAGAERLGDVVVLREGGDGVAHADNCRTLATYVASGNYVVSR